MIDSIWEDNLLEKKLESDLKDLLKTLVAFANSVKPNHKAILLIGERDDGIVQGVTNPDNIQKQIRKDCEKIYPPIIWRSTVYEKENKFCIRVEVDYDGETPHFGGIAWVRKGSESIIASEEMFQQLIDLRLELVRELALWLDKEVSVYGDQSSIPSKPRNPNVHYSPFDIGFIHRWKAETSAKIVSVNKFWVTFENIETHEKMSEPLGKLTLSYDDKKERLKVIVAY